MLSASSPFSGVFQYSGQSGEQPCLSTVLLLGQPYSNWFLKFGQIRSNLPRSWWIKDQWLFTPGSCSLLAVVVRVACKIYTSLFFHPWKDLLGNCPLCTCRVWGKLLWCRLPSVRQTDYSLSTRGSFSLWSMSRFCSTGPYVLLLMVLESHDVMW